MGALAERRHEASPYSAHRVTATPQLLCPKRNTWALADAGLVAPFTTPKTILPPWGLSMVFSGDWAHALCAEAPARISHRTDETEKRL